VPCKVLGCGTDGDRGLEDLEAYVGPFASGFQVDAPGSQSIDEVTACGFEGVCADEDWAGDFVGFKEFDCLSALKRERSMGGLYLGDREHFEEFAGQVGVVRIIRSNIFNQPLNVILPLHTLLT
jgi:hypothetical protein